MRREFPARVKVAAYERSKGVCEGCGGPLQVGRFHYDHRIPDAMGGEPTLENCVVLCIGCHGAKTTRDDVPAIAKAKRREARHLGAYRAKRLIPGSKGTGFRKHIDGRVTRRKES